ncbi:MAG: hypothetical protein WCI74_06590 [Actinomycetes bacterium]
MHDNETGDHFVPPPVAPISSQIGDPVKFAAICGVIGAPIVFVFSAIFFDDWRLQFGFGVLCVVVFVVSFIVLFVRAGKSPSHPREGWEDGTEL